MKNINEIIEHMKKGNEKYVTAITGNGDISPEIRKKTALEGQNPYAIVITCSDSRVIPESIFSAGIGELFVIRVAGNVIDNHQLASIEYAVSHLGTPLVMVLGHTNCGAVGAAIKGNNKDLIKTITDKIEKAIGNEKDPYKAARLNVSNSLREIREVFEDMKEVNIAGLVGGIYDIETGVVEWM